MKLDVGDIIALAALFVTAITATAGLMVWFANSEKKKYGQERDIQHLNRNLTSMQQGIDTLLREHDRRFDLIDSQLLEIRTKIAN